MKQYYFKLNNIIKKNKICNESLIENQLKNIASDFTTIFSVLVSM